MVLEVRFVERLGFEDWSRDSWRCDEVRMDDDGMLGLSGQGNQRRRMDWGYVTCVEGGAVGGSGYGVECYIRGSALEGELGLEPIAGRGRVDFCGEGKEDGGDGESFHF